MPNNMRWELRSYVFCKDINIIYYLKCNVYKKAYIGKMARNNFVDFKIRINQHISHFRTGISICNFPMHVYHCAKKNNCLKKLYFHLNIMTKLKDSQQLELYEKQFHKRLWCYWQICLCFVIENLHSEEQMRNA